MTEKSNNENNNLGINLNTEFLESLKKQKKNMELPRSSKLNIPQIEIFLKEMETKYTLDRNQIVTSLTILFQLGGTARSCDGNLTAKIFDREIKLADIRAILRKMGQRNAERKLARALATQIHKIATVLEIPGNLSKKIIKNNPDLKLTIEELAWLSDFQSDNEDCPGPLKKYINECFKTKNNNTIPNNNSNRKTGK